MDREKFFKCDESIKEEFKETLVNILDKCGFLVNFDMEKCDNPLQPIDLYFTALDSATSKEINYAVEVKERLKDSPTDYGGQWMVEKKKLLQLEQAFNEGYKTYYCNIWKNKDFALWDYETIRDKGVLYSMSLPKYTVTPTEQIMKPVYMVDVKDAHYYGKLQCS